MLPSLVKLLCDCVFQQLMEETQLRHGCSAGSPAHASSRRPKKVSIEDNKVFIPTPDGGANHDVNTYLSDEQILEMATKDIALLFGLEVSAQCSLHIYIICAIT